MNRLSRVAVSVSTVVVGVLLAVTLVVVLSRSPGHQELFERQQMMEQQLRYISCLLLVLPEERSPEAVAACQVPPDD